MNSLAPIGTQSVKIISPINPSFPYSRKVSLGRILDISRGVGRGKERAQLIGKVRAQAREKKNSFLLNISCTVVAGTQQLMIIETEVWGYSLLDR